MKGKGEKGNRQSLNSSASEDVSLNFPPIKTFDHAKNCLQFTAVISKDEEDYITLDEIDNLQSDLELILASLSKRNKSLHAEVQMLITGLEKSKDKLGSSPCGALTPQSTGSVSSSVDQQSHYSTSAVTTAQKRNSKGKSTEEPPAKRMRTDSGRATYAQPIPSKGKGKNHQDLMEPTATSQIKVPKNITPNRFWAMVEPYCAEITKEDLRFLEEQIKLCEDIGDCMKVPPLGKHYTEKWSEEDLLLEQGELTKLTDRKKGGATTATNLNNIIDTKPEKTNAENDSASVLFGPLTQRLVQALLEEDTGLENVTMLSEADAYEAATIAPKSLAQQLQIEDSAELEKRIKRELHNQGILDSDDSENDDGTTDDRSRSLADGHNNKSNDDDDDDDEILIELRKKQNELRTLSVQNCQMLRTLLKMGREEMAMQDLRKKLSAADAEVEEAYKKLQAYKVKKKVPSKKEKEVFFKALQDRKVILKQLHKSKDASAE